MLFLPWHLAAAYILDLIVGDPFWLPHPVRWIGSLITRLENVLHDRNLSSTLQRIAGTLFWLCVVTVVMSAAIVIIRAASRFGSHFSNGILIWLAFTTLATRSLHRESARVALALLRGDLPAARELLSRIVSRDTAQLGERDIVRALIETVSENISDGVIAPLFYLALGGPPVALLYKAVNTMDSMVGYKNERYRHFGWFAARADDAANFIPARLTALLVIGAAACLGLDRRGAWRILRRDARLMKSPNAGYPEAAAAGALGVQVGGANIYFGKPVEKPVLGDPSKELTLATYRSMVRLMYVTSFLGFVFALGLRFFILNI
ncbi:MAG: adenosylcobinamide-phosphate synthase CbiB [Syntrophobacteraceae bacterium]